VLNSAHFQNKKKFKRTELKYSILIIKTLHLITLESNARDRKVKKEKAFGWASLKYLAVLVNLKNSNKHTKSEKDATTYEA
jgi:hypothetical protein